MGSVGKHNVKAVVGITARLVDTATAEILAAVTGTGQSTRSGTSLLGAGGGGGNAAGGGYDMSSSNFADTLLGEAVYQAVDSMATQLDDKAASLPTRKIEINGVVADVTGNVLVLNVGGKDGLKVGDTLDISRPIKTVKDPATGKVLRTITSKMGIALVTDVDAQSATANYTGVAPAKVGDTVKNSQ
jgi:hypothetical protein